MAGAGAGAGTTLRMVKIQLRSQLFGHEGLHSKHGLSNRLTRQWALIQLNMLLSVNQQHSISSFQMLALSKWMNLCLLSYKLQREIRTGKLLRSRWTGLIMCKLLVWVYLWLVRNRKLWKQFITTPQSSYGELLGVARLRNCHSFYSKQAMATGKVQIQ